MIDLNLGDLYGNKSTKEVKKMSFKALKDNLGLIFSDTWYFILLGAIVMALMSYFNTSSLLKMKDVNQMILLNDTFILKLISGLFSIVIYLLVESKVFSGINHQSLKWNFIRNIKFSLPLFLILYIPYFVILGITMPSLSTSSSTFFCLYLFWFLLLIPTAYSYMNYIIDEKLTLKEAYTDSYVIGFKNYGFILVSILRILFYILLAFLMMIIISIPLYIISFGTHWLPIAYTISFLYFIYYFVVFIFLFLFLFLNYYIYLAIKKEMDEKNILNSEVQKENVNDSIQEKSIEE